MTEIEAKSDGVVSKALDTIKQWADKFFGFLSKVATDVKDEYVNSKTKRRVFIDKETSLPMAVEFERISDDAGEMRVYININDSYKKNPVVYKDIPYDISNEDLDSFYKDAMKKLIKTLDDDDKGAFGIKTSREIQARLHKVVGKRETSIKLTGIKANFNISEANAIFADILDNDEFIEQLPEEPTDFLITDGAEGYEVEDYMLSDEDEYIKDSLSEILCASTLFYMNMQLMDWSASRSVELKGITANQLWMAQDRIRFLGDLYVELTDSMFNPFLCADFTAQKEWTLGSVTKEDIADACNTLAETIEFYCPNFSIDVQNTLCGYIRELKHIANYELKMG